MVYKVSEFKLVLQRIIKAHPAYDVLRESRLRELRGLVSELKLVAGALDLDPSLRLWRELCMLTRRYILIFQDRWLTLQGEWFQETSGDFISLLDSSLAQRERVLASTVSIGDRETVEKYYKNMKGRRDLSRHVDSRDPDAVYEFLWDSESSSEAAKSASFSRGGIPSSDVARAVFLVAAERALTLKCLSIALELKHEAGPFAVAIVEHYAFARSASKICKILMRLAEGATTPVVREAFGNCEQLLAELKQTVCSPLEQFCKERSQLTPLPALGETNVEFEAKASNLVQNLKSPVNHLITKSDLQWKRLVARLPETAWEAWSTLGALDGGMQPPDPTSTPAAVTVDLGQFLKALPQITDFAALQGWLDFIRNHGTTTQSGISPDDAVLTILHRMIDLNFDATKSLIQSLITTTGKHFSRSNFSLLVVGMLVGAVKIQSNPTDVDRRWLNELFDAAAEMDIVKIGRQQSKEALLATLLSLSFFTDSNDEESATLLEGRLDRCLESNVADESRPYFLQILADSLSRLIPPARSNEYIYKLIVLRRHLQMENVRWRDGDIFTSIDRVVDRVRTFDSVQ